MLTSYKKGVYDMDLLAHSENILDLLDQGILNYDLKKSAEHKPKTNHYIGDWGTMIDSNYVGNCIRKQVYQWWDIKPTNVEPKRKYSPAVGSLIGDFIPFIYSNFSALKKVETEVEVLVRPLKLLNPIKGRIDMLLTHQDDSVTMVELKTCHGRAINSAQFGMRKLGAKQEYINQVCFYYDHHEGRVDTVKILVFSREDFNRLEFTMGVDFEHINTKDYRCFELVEKYLSAKELPPKTYTAGKDKYPCSWCEFRTRCYDFDMDSKEPTDSIYIDQELNLA